MGEDDTARLGRRSRSVEDFGDGASRRRIAGIHASFCRGGRAIHDIFQVVDNHRGWRSGQFHLLTVTQNELHARIFDHPLNELAGRGCVHRDNDAPTQEDSPEASDPFGGVWTPEKYAITWDNSASGERITPEKSVGVEFAIRQLFPTVAASLDDGHVAAEAGEFCK